MLITEDLDIMKQTAAYNLSFQRVAAFRDCPFTLRKEVEKHLRYLMCDKKRNMFQHNAFVIKTEHKMPTDAMEFEYVYVSKFFKN